VAASGVDVGEVPAARRARAPGGKLALALVLALLIANLVVRGAALPASAGTGIAIAALSTLGLGVLLLVIASGAWLAPSLTLFGASFLLYGFHSYRPQSQVFELLLAAFALVLLLRLPAERGWFGTAAVGGVLPLLALYALVAGTSLLLLPWPVLEARAFIEGAGLGQALLGAFPKDSLYPFASVNRLWLFVLFAALLAAQPDGRRLCRALSRGVAAAAVLAAALGLLDFAGLLPLDRYNLSNVFYGVRYRRLQSTFGNPSWFACFVACAMPLLLLELREARGRARFVLALAFPVVGASLVLSGSRASWLAAGLVVAVSAGGLVAVRRLGRPVPRPDAASWLALGSTLAVVAALAATALTTPTTRQAREEGPPGRFEGLSRELQYRGLGVQSPRRVAIAYALELARLAPVRGLGYESFNLHLRSQLEIPRSGVARVVNTAVAYDSSETLFDDSHNTYLQVLTGTGALGLTLFLLSALAGLRLAVLALRRDASAEALAVLSGLAVFHFYGLFQGMAYIPVTFFLLPLITAWAATLHSQEPPASAGRRSRAWIAGAALLLASAAAYAADTGYSSLKRRFAVEAYLPEERTEFDGFYRPEMGEAGEFRWMRKRAIVNARRPAPFRLTFTCGHPDADREPVVLSLSFDGRELEPVVFRRPGSIERRFDLGRPGTLRLVVSRTFRPGGADPRELGVAVSAMKWE
jgi:hypothetical protein